MRGSDLPGKTKCSGSYTVRISAGLQAIPMYLLRLWGLMPD